jgi:hypothetical protein
MSLKRPLWRAVGLGTAAGAAAWVFAQWDGALRLVLLLAIAVAWIAWNVPSLGVKLLDGVIHRLRAYHWREAQGRHHAFAGVPLQVEDDGRHVWLGGDGLKRVLASHDSDEVLAARHTGRWRRHTDGQLLLRVDAVVDVLAQGPGRLDPRTIRLRRYLEREVLFPAAERRRRRQAP